MMSVAYSQRQNVSMMLVLSMIFSLWLTVAPVGQLHASMLGSVKNVAKSVFVNVGAVAAGLFGGVIGMAVGGGPLGMAVGGVGGFIVGKKVLNWTVSSVANFATVAGAIAGGALCLGMGFPMLAVGVIGGGLIARLAVKGVSKLFGKKPVIMKHGDVNPAVAAQESAVAAAFFDKLNKKSEDEPAAKKEEPSVAPSKPSAPSVSDSQTAYNNYVAAYKSYMEATQKGNAALAQSSYADYKKNLDMYNSLIKAGK